MLRHADADFNNLLLNSVPPVDLTRVNIFSGHLSKYSAEVENDNTQKAAQFLSWHFIHNHFRQSSLSNTRLSAQLLQTTWQQSKLQFESDVNKLKEWAGRWGLFSSQQVPRCKIQDKTYRTKRCEIICWKDWDKNHPTK